MKSNCAHNNAPKHNTIQYKNIGQIVQAAKGRHDGNILRMCPSHNGCLAPIQYQPGVRH